MSNRMNEGGRVRIVTLSDCDYCKWLKSELDANQISYTNIDADVHNEFADRIEKQYGTDKYPIVIIDMPPAPVVILPETNLDTSRYLRTFDTIPELIGIIKSYIK